MVKKTWAKDAKHIHYFSETEDPSIPTVDLGVDNTESGNCHNFSSVIPLPSRTLV